MPCKCNGRLDSIMKYLQDMKKDIRDVQTEIGAVKTDVGAVKTDLGVVKTEVGALKTEICVVVKKDVGVVKTEIGDMKKEVGVVKTKCNRIEKEILGITAESEVNADALMETTTVRHLVEKLSFDVSALTLETNKQKSSEEKRQREMEAANKDLHSKFAESITAKINDLKLKYDVVAPETFQAEFYRLQKEFRSETEEDLFHRGFSSFIIHDVMQDVVVRATDSDNLHVVHFLDKYEEMGRVIRGQYKKAVVVFAAETIEKEGIVDDFLQVGQNVIIAGFLNNWKLCEASFTSFQTELLNEFRQTKEQIEANRSLLLGLTIEYRHRLLQFLDLVGFPSKLFEERKVAALKREITVSDQKLVPVFVNKLRQNIQDINADFLNDRWEAYSYVE